MTGTTTHAVTAIEPLWVEQTYEPDEDGRPEPQGGLDPGEPIDVAFDAADYECSCGAELDSWGDVQAHFDDVVPSTDCSAEVEGSTDG